MQIHANVAANGMTQPTIMPSSGDSSVSRRRSFQPLATHPLIFLCRLPAILCLPAILPYEFELFLLAAMLLEHARTPWDHSGATWDEQGTTLRTWPDSPIFELARFE